MAKCKICKTNIPDEIEYCDNCKDKKTKISNESYLDGLLNSIKNTTPSVEKVYKKKNKASSSDIMPASQQLVQDNLDNRSDIDELHSPEVVSGNQIENDWQDYVAYSVDLSDIEEFDKYNLEDDLSDAEAEYLVSDIDLFGQDISELTKDFSEGNNKIIEANEIINDTAEPAELLQETIDSVIMQESIDYKEPVENLSESSNLSEQAIQEESLYGSDFNEQSLDDENLYGSGFSEQSLNEENNLSEESLFQQNLMEQNPQSEVIGSQSSIYEDELLKSKSSQLMKNDQASIKADRNDADQLLVDTPEYDENLLIEDIPDLEDEDFDPDLNQLLDSFNMIPEDYHSDMEGQAENRGKENMLEEDNANFDASEEFDEMGTDADDFLSLLRQMSSDDPVSEDVKAINDLLQGKPAEPSKSNNMPGDVGEVFSDALKGISSLTDLEENEEALLNQVPNKKSKKTKRAKKEKKPKKKVEADGEKPKKSFLQFLFGNVKDETKADASREEANVIGASEAKSPKGKVKKSKGKADPSIEDTGNGKKAGNAKKAKKGKKGTAASGEEGSNVKAAKKEKKEKKKKKKSSREIIQVIDEIEEDEGRINRLGAALVFLFFGLLVTLILVGTNTVSYAMSIEKATDYFGNREYTDAYNQVYGMEIKDEDFAIYNKIMTVMYVNKQLNSYNNYYSIGKYPQALDSLLKGLRRYDKYIELATMLGIENDLKYVRKQILAELKNEFNLSQKQAMEIISYDNMMTYSLAVYDVVDKNITD